MLEYVQHFIIGHQFGYGYLITNAVLVLAAVLLLNDIPRGKRILYQLLPEYIVCCLVYLILDSFFYMILGGISHVDTISRCVFVILYSVFRSKYDFRVCLVRGWTYIASTMVIIPITEPLGILLSSVRAEYYRWSQFLTPLAMVVLILGEVWFMRHFSFNTGSIVGGQYVLLNIMIAAVAIIIESYLNFTGVLQEDRGSHVLICACLLVLILMAYYLFYTIERSARANIELSALNQKAELEKEKYYATKINYDELRSIRHEIKNHDFYLKALLEQGKVDDAIHYLERVSGSGADYLQSFDSGNYVIDVVMNHEMAAAKEQNVIIDPEILVPAKLPFRDEDLCSLLSNLLDNAIEGAAKSGEKEPHVGISILPRQEYLFIRVVNPVDVSLPEKRRMTLETTKTKDKELHGFGTRIIKLIAEKYAGSVKYSMADGKFITDVMLENPEEEGEER